MKIFIHLKMVRMVSETIDYSLLMLTKLIENGFEIENHSCSFSRQIQRQSIVFAKEIYTESSESIDFLLPHLWAILTGPVILAL